MHIIIHNPIPVRKSWQLLFFFSPSLSLFLSNGCPKSQANGHECSLPPTSASLHCKKKQATLQVIEHGVSWSHKSKFWSLMIIGAVSKNYIELSYSRIAGFFCFWFAFVHQSCFPRSYGPTPNSNSKQPWSVTPLPTPKLRKPLSLAEDSAKLEKYGWYSWWLMAQILHHLECSQHRPST